MLLLFPTSLSKTSAQVTLETEYLGKELRSHPLLTTFKTESENKVATFHRILRMQAFTDKNNVDLEDSNGTIDHSESP